MSITLANLINLDVHNEKAMKNLLVKGVKRINEFDWIMNMPYYWDKRLKTRWMWLRREISPNRFLIRLRICRQHWNISNYSIKSKMQFNINGSFEIKFKRGSSRILLGSHISQLYLRVRQGMVICELVELIWDLLDRGITYIVDYELSVFIYDA